MTKSQVSYDIFCMGSLIVTYSDIYKAGVSNDFGKCHQLLSFKTDIIGPQKNMHTLDNLAQTEIVLICFDMYIIICPCC